tara:strand:+ start:1043 stop:2590 length:1548 start_codon:yes stop_codon:yes gene_type:complete
MRRRQEIADMRARQQAPAAPQTRQQAPVAPQTPKDSAYDDFGQGTLHSLLSTGYGVQDLASEYLPDGWVDRITPEERSNLAALKENANESGWGTGGQVFGEVAQLMLPAGLIGKGAKALQTAGKLPKALSVAKATLAGDVALGAGYGGLQLPDDGESRTTNALQEAVATLGGGVVGGSLRKAVKGLNRSKAGDELIKEGIELTPAQALESGIPKGAEYVMGVLPLLARGVKKAKERATDSYNKVLLNKVSPIGKVIKEGNEGIKELKGQFTDAYSKAWSGATQPTGRAVATMRQLSENVRAELGGNGAVVLKGITKDLDSLASSPDPVKALKQLDNTLRKKIVSAAKTGEEGLETTLKDLRARLRESAGAKVQEALAKVDSKYGDFIAVRDGGSAKAVMEAGGIMEPTQLMAGVKSAGGKTRAATGDAPMYGFAKQGVDTIGQQVPNPIMDFMRGFSKYSPTVLPLKMIGKQLTGTGALQGVAQKPYNSALSEALRDFGARGSIAGGQYLSNEDE